MHDRGLGNSRALALRQVHRELVRRLAELKKRQQKLRATEMK